MDLPSVGTMIVCSNCNENVAFEESAPWSKHLRTSLQCRSNDTRMRDRCSRNPQLKARWKQQNKERKTTWFQRNKRANEGTVGTYGRKQFEDPTMNESEAFGSRISEFGPRSSSKGDACNVEKGTQQRECTEEEAPIRSLPHPLLQRSPVQAWPLSGAAAADSTPGYHC